MTHDEYKGLYLGLAYSLAQNNGGKATMAIDFAEEDLEGFEAVKFEEVINEMEDECRMTSFKVEKLPHLFIRITMATTENDESLPEDW